MFNSGGTADSRGYVWYQSSGNLTINNNSTIPAGRKVVVYVAGNVTINGRINLASLNSFFKSSYFDKLASREEVSRS